MSEKINIATSNMNEIPFLNLPNELSWGARYQEVLTFYKNHGVLRDNLKSDERYVIEIEDNWNGIYFHAWLVFSRFFKKLNSVSLGITKKDLYQNRNIDAFIDAYSLLVRIFGEPKFQKGILLEELKTIKNINLVDLSKLPHFEWKNGNTKIVLEYIHHWDIVFQLILIPNK